MITYRRTTYDWQFVFIGPEQALPYALRIGIPKSNVVSFSTDPAGITAIMARLSKSMQRYLLGDKRYALALDQWITPKKRSRSRQWRSKRYRSSRRGVRIFRFRRRLAFSVVCVWPRNGWNLIRFAPKALLPPAIGRRFIKL